MKIGHFTIFTGKGKTNSVIGLSVRAAGAGLKLFLDGLPAKSEG